MNSYVKRLSLVAAALTVAAVLFLPAMLHGDEFNLKTYITVSQPFQVPASSQARTVRAKYDITRYSLPINLDV